MGCVALLIKFIIKFCLTVPLILWMAKWSENSSILQTHLQAAPQVLLSRAEILCQLSHFLSGTHIGRQRLLNRYRNHGVSEVRVLVNCVKSFGRMNSYSRIGCDLLGIGNRVFDCMIQGMNLLALPFSEFDSRTSLRLGSAITATPALAARSRAARVCRRLIVRAM